MNTQDMNAEVLDKIEKIIFEGILDLLETKQQEHDVCYNQMIMYHQLLEKIKTMLDDYQITKRETVTLDQLLPKSFGQDHLNK
jgi:hypothetical protein